MNEYVHHLVHTVRQIMSFFLTLMSHLVESIATTQLIKAQSTASSQQRAQMLFVHSTLQECTVGRRIMFVPQRQFESVGRVMKII